MRGGGGASPWRSRRSGRPSASRRFIKVERGDPTVSIASYATVLYVLGMADRLGDLAAPKNDPVGLQLEEENLPQRIRGARKQKRSERQVMDKETLVYVDLDGAPHLMGRLWARVRKNKESATFEYDEGWLNIPRGSRWSRRSSSAPARSTRRPIRRCSARSATRRRTGGGGR